MPKPKKDTTNFLEYSIVSDKLPKNWQEAQKMFGENWLIFALEPKQELDAESLVLHLGPKFLYLGVHFYKYFWFWYQREIVSEKVYAVI